jgi:hypothetical protein
MNQDLSNFQSYLKGKVDGYAMAEHEIEKLNARVRELEKENAQLKYDFNYFGFMPQDEIRADERRKVLELLRGPEGWQVATEADMLADWLVKMWSKNKKDSHEP